MQDRAAARDALVARTTGMGLSLTLLAAALTGGVTGVLARSEPLAAEPVPSPSPASGPVPRPRRTVYVRVPAVAAPEVTRTTTRPATRRAPRPPAAPPIPARQPAVTTSSGS